MLKRKSRAERIGGRKLLMMEGTKDRREQGWGLLDKRIQSLGIVGGASGGGTSGGRVPAGEGTSGRGVLFFSYLSLPSVVKAQTYETYVSGTRTPESGRVHYRVYQGRGF